MIHNSAHHFLPRHITFYFYAYNPHISLQPNHSGWCFWIRKQFREAFLMEPPPDTLWLFSSRPVHPQLLSVPPLTAEVQCFYFPPSAGLHADGNLCVYFKNRFATLRIPALNPACRCPATLTGTLLSGAATRGCQQLTRPLEIIISLVPESITRIQWSVRPLETHADGFPAPSSFLCRKYSINSYSLLHIQSHFFPLKIGDTILETINCFNTSIQRLSNSCLTDSKFKTATQMYFCSLFSLHNKIL